MFRLLHFLFSFPKLLISNKQVSLTLTFICRRVRMMINPLYALQTTFGKTLLVQLGGVLVVGGLFALVFVFGDLVWGWVRHIETSTDTTRGTNECT